jgi:hypothetical protein
MLCTGIKELQSDVKSKTAQRDCTKRHVIHLKEEFNIYYTKAHKVYIELTKTRYLKP